MALNPQPSTCLPHASLAICAHQLDHWFQTETLLFQQIQLMLRAQATSTPSQADPPSPSPTPRSPGFGFPRDFGPRISDFAPLTLLTLKPLLDWEKLLLKHAQFALACQKLQNKAAHPREPHATDTRDRPPDNSQAIALMRKTFFADVDEYERSGRLKIPPMSNPNPDRDAHSAPSPATPPPGCAT